jgi:hypothetical protein
VLTVEQTELRGDTYYDIVRSVSVGINCDIGHRRELVDLFLCGICDDNFVGIDLLNLGSAASRFVTRGARLSGRGDVHMANLPTEGLPETLDLAGDPG